MSDKRPRQHDDVVDLSLDSDEDEGVLKRKARKVEESPVPSSRSAAVSSAGGGLDEDVRKRLAAKFQASQSALPSSSSSSSTPSSAAVPTQASSSVIDIDALTIFGKTDNLVAHVNDKLSLWLLDNLDRKNFPKKARSIRRIQAWIQEARENKADNKVIEIINNIATNVKDVFPAGTKNRVSFSFYWPAYTATVRLPAADSALKHSIIRTWWGGAPFRNKEGRLQADGHWWWWFNTAFERQDQTNGWSEIYGALSSPGVRDNFEASVLFAWREHNMP